MIMLFFLSLLVFPIVSHAESPLPDMTMIHVPQSVPVRLRQYQRITDEQKILNIGIYTRMHELCTQKAMTIIENSPQKAQMDRSLDMYRTRNIQLRKKDSKKATALYKTMQKTKDALLETYCQYQPGNEPVVVDVVYSGGYAEQLGLEGGDVISHVNDIPLTSDSVDLAFNSIAKKCLAADAGCSLTVIKNNKKPLSCNTINTEGIVSTVGDACMHDLATASSQKISFVCKTLACVLGFEYQSTPLYCNEGEEFCDRFSFDRRFLTTKRLFAFYRAKYIVDNLPGIALIE